MDESEAVCSGNEADLRSETHLFEGVPEKENEQTEEEASIEAVGGSAAHSSSAMATSVSCGPSDNAVGDVSGSRPLSSQADGTIPKAVPEQMRSYMEIHGPDGSVIVPRSIFSDLGGDNDEEGLSAFGIRPRPLVSPSITPGQERAFINSFVELLSMPITRQDQEYIWSLPQHLANGDANPLWLLFRIGRCTGSMSGDVFKVNPYCSRFKRLKELLWKKFKGNIMTRYGNDNEDNAQAAFELWMSSRLLDEEEDEEGYMLVDVAVENYGLCVCRQFPPFAMSPDGVLVEVWEKRSESQPESRPAGANQAVTGGKRPNGCSQEWREDGLYDVKVKRILVEYKCPFRARNKRWYDDQDVYKMEATKRHPANKDGARFRLPVPSYYFAQCNYGMHVLGIMDDLLTRPEYTYFVVWHPAFYGDSDLDFWTSPNESGTSFTVASTSGTIQVTKLEYNAEYCREMMGEVRDFWYNEYAPALWRKLTGRLTEGQLDPPAVTLDFSDDDDAVPDFPGLKLRPGKKNKRKKADAGSEPAANARTKRAASARTKRAMNARTKKEAVETIDWNDDEKDTFEFANISSFT